MKVQSFFVWFFKYAAGGGQGLGVPLWDRLEPRSQVSILSFAKYANLKTRPWSKS